MDTITFHTMPASPAYPDGYTELRANGVPLMTSADADFLQEIALEARMEVLAEHMHTLAFDVLHHAVVGRENMRLASQDAL